MRISIVTAATLTVVSMAMSWPVLAEPAPSLPAPAAKNPAPAPGPAAPTTAKQIPTKLPNAKGGCPSGSTPYDLDYRGPGTMRCKVHNN